MMVIIISLGVYTYQKDVNMKKGNKTHLKGIKRFVRDVRKDMTDCKKSANSGSVSSGPCAFTIHRDNLSTIPTLTV